MSLSVSFRVKDWGFMPGVPYTPQHGYISMDPLDHSGSTIYLHGTQEELLAFAERIRAYVAPAQRDSDMQSAMKIAGDLQRQPDGPLSTPEAIAEEASKTLGPVREELLREKLEDEAKL